MMVLVHFIDVDNYQKKNKEEQDVGALDRAEIPPFQL